MSDDRVFYCPTHGRVTEEEYWQEVLTAGWEDGHERLDCRQCRAWYFRLRPPRVKRTGES